MTWRVEFNPWVEHDVAEAAAWYEGKRAGLHAARHDTAWKKRLE